MTVRLLPFVLVACGSFSPEPGVWESRNTELVSDDCAQFPADDPTNRPAVTFDLTVDEDASEFDIAVGVTCTLDPDDQTFACPDDELDRVPLAGNGFDAVVILTQTVGGRFEDTDMAAVDLDLFVSCEGPDCGDLNGENDPFSAFDVPCSTELDATWTRLPI